MMDLVPDVLVMLIAFKLTDDSVLSLFNTIMNMTTYMIMRDLLRKIHLYLSSSLAEISAYGKDAVKQNEGSKAYRTKSKSKSSISLRDTEQRPIQSTSREENHDKHIGNIKAKERRDLVAFNKCVQQPSEKGQKGSKTLLTSKNLASFEKARNQKDNCRTQ